MNKGLNLGALLVDGLMRRMQCGAQTKFFRHSTICSLLLSALFLSEVAVASCSSGENDVASRYLADSKSSDDDIERLVLAKRSLKSCKTFAGWLELGRVQLALDNSRDAVSAFENARDFYQPDTSGVYTSAQLKRVALATAWLADAYYQNEDLATASVAIQEAAHAYRLLRQTPSQRLVNLQARLDDAMASADASVMARTLDLQHQRASRGIGVRAKVREVSEPAEEAAELRIAEAEYEDAEVAGELEPTVTASSNESVVAAAVPESSYAESNTGGEPKTETRLNIPVLFEFDSAELSVESLKSVEQLGVAINALELDTMASVFVIGHTDSRGDANYNQQLSLQRARTVLATFQKLVTSTPNFEAQGKGENELRYFGNSKDDHRRNRRVEIVLVR